MNEPSKDTANLQKVLAEGLTKPLGSPMSSVLVILIVFCAIGLSVLVVTARRYTVDARLHDLYSGSLRSLIAFDAQLNEAVLKTSGGMSASYDPLQRVIQKLDSTSARIKNSAWPIPYFPSEGSTSVEQSFAEFQSLLAQKELLIDSFQAESSVVRNSHNYFPIGVKTLVKDRQKESPTDPLAASLIVLLQRVSLYTLQPIQEHDESCRSELSFIEQSLLSHAGPQKDEVRLLLLHARVILDREQILSAAVRQVLSVKTGELADTTRKRYEEEYQLALRRSDTYRLLASGLVVLIVMLSAALVIHKLKRSASALQHERERSEKLLLNVLPEPIAQRLKQSPEVIADSFPTVTVLFADLVGFSQLSAQLPAIDLVRLLNRVFSALDLLAEKHGLEKIKTIGDAYMVVAGLPVARSDHAEAMAEFALATLKELESLRDELSDRLQFRIGINSGSVVAGVIGLRKFSYDLWGHTVNLASRMEAHGVPGAIHCSESTYQLLQAKYVFDPRGPIAIKGIGTQSTYLLQQRKLTEPT